MIDIHCHILPAIDDGPADLEGALAMARVASAAGTRQLVATPHVGPEVSPPEQLAERVERFNEALRQQAIDLEVLVGADNLYNLGSSLLSRYCIHGGPYLLIEFPHTHLPADAGQVIFDLHNAGLKPIITHPERNPSIIENPQLLQALVEQGALVQLTGESLTGGFGVSAQSCARYLLRQGMVHFLASDGHSANWRPPTLVPGLKVASKLLGKPAASQLVTDNPARVLARVAWPTH